VVSAQSSYLGWIVFFGRCSDFRRGIKSAAFFLMRGVMAAFKKHLMTAAAILAGLSLIGYGLVRIDEGYLVSRQLSKIGTGGALVLFALVQINIKRKGEVD